MLMEREGRNIPDRSISSRNHRSLSADKADEGLA